MLFSYFATVVAQQLCMFDGPGIESSHNARNFILLKVLIIKIRPTLNENFLYVSGHYHHIYPGANDLRC